MDTQITRRNALRGIGIATMAGLAGNVSAASGSRRVVVHPNNGNRAAASAVREGGGEVLLTYDNFDFIAASVPERSLPDVAEDRRVALVEDDPRVTVTHHKTGHSRGGPNKDDGSDDDGGDSETTPDGYDRIGAGNVDESDGAGVKIGFLDTGVDTDHEDLTVAGGTDFTSKGSYEDGHGHGTHTLGTATADENGLGVVGVAHAADPYAVKVLDDDGSGYGTWVIGGIDWCINNGIEIISMSLKLNSMSDSMDESLRTAYSNGHLSVAAAGNWENDDDGSCEEDNVLFPARHPDVMAVSALWTSGVMSANSSVGPEIEIAGPAPTDSTWNNGGYEQMWGTSVACPHVSGTAALAWAVYGSTGPDATVRDEIRTILQNTADPKTNSCEEGHGLVDADGAVDAAVANQ